MPRHSRCRGGPVPALERPARLRRERRVSASDGSEGCPPNAQRRLALERPVRSGGSHIPSPLGLSSSDLSASGGSEGEGIKG